MTKYSSSSFLLLRLYKDAGLADNYDFIFFHISGSGYYTSTHMNTHQPAVGGTGTGAINLGGCGGSRVKGVTLMQPLDLGSMGPLYHEFLHEYVLYTVCIHFIILNGLLGC